MSLSDEAQKEKIRPLHTGFGFFAETIIDKSHNSPNKKIELSDEYLMNSNDEFELNNVILDNSISTQIIENSTPLSKTDESIKRDRRSEVFKSDQRSTAVDSNYFVHPFFAFLAWTVDALVGFCFLVISLCVNTVFIPKGFFDVTSSLVKYFSIATGDLGVLYTFLFSLQVWFFMAILVFLFQYSILGFEGATLGRWLFGISIQNNRDKNGKVAERTKFCAALSEAMLLGSILSFLFIILLPSRVPIFFWMRYSSKNL
ncbi:hypothetical protein [Fluviispira multicolorata]|uniref:RDD family protein n=1 Tax=Fluviispira multicolorata TaxID=2654512 RepID=A0A833N2Q4_9BACT|nr:hypothetical protein [Fluviispira multicolorata]KAB8033203.1 hypothetical protein GCL57_00465 [Fluviispira multicolorata]